jgi:GNAT superfamily N-acetyltransferase
VTIDSRSGASYQRELGDGLRLRWSTAADAGRLRALYGHVFRDRPADPPDPLGDAWVVDLLSGRYPLIAPGDFALVEAADGRLVAAACLMRQAWEYGGVAIPVGRPELVASHPDYRRRGLVRRIFELLHARSAARGDLALGITGICYFYRQFGYEYALDLNGGRVVPFSAIPARRAGAAEPYRLRDATPAELPCVQALYDRARAPAQMSTPIDAGYWRWVIDGMDPASGEGWRTQCIVDAAGATVGLLLTRRARWRGALAVSGLAVEPRVGGAAAGGAAAGAARAARAGAGAAGGQARRPTGAGAAPELRPPRPSGLRRAGRGARRAGRAALQLVRARAGPAGAAAPPGAGAGAAAGRLGRRRLERRAAARLLPRRPVADAGARAAGGRRGVAGRAVGRGAAGRLPAARLPAAPLRPPPPGRVALRLPRRLGERGGRAGAGGALPAAAGVGPAAG